MITSEQALAFFKAHVAEAKDWHIYVWDEDNQVELCLHHTHWYIISVHLNHESVARLGLNDENEHDAPIIIEHWNEFELSSVNYYEELDGCHPLDKFPDWT